MKRTGELWDAFVNKQRVIILKRLQKYKNVDTASDSLKETGEVCYYQYYKSSTVSKYLLRTLDKIDEGSYAICNVYKKEIPIARIEIVPGAISCVGCDEEKIINS